MFCARIALAFLIISGSALGQTYVISTVAGGAPASATATKAFALTVAGGGPSIIYTLAGTGNAGYSGDRGPATSAQVNFPGGMCLDSAGNLYIADFLNHRVRKVSPDGVITTVAGTGIAGFSGDGGPATSAQFNRPYGVTVDGAGNLYIADWDNNRVRRVTPGGIVNTVAGTGPGGSPGDGGPATGTLLALPTSVATDGAGNLFIAEMYGRVRKVSPNGVISTIAGTGRAGYSGDGGPATSAQFSSNVIALFLDGAGNLFIADRGNHRIRKVSPAGIITTVAGNGVPGFSGDGGPATGAQLNGPSGVTVDSTGNIYIADTANHRVRQVCSTGVITTAAGNGNQVHSGDGGPPTSAGIGNTFGLATDSAGNLYISDVYNSRVRIVRTGAAAGGPSANTPVIFAGGVVNAASNAAGQPIAAGSLVSIYGANLAASTAQSSSVPLPTSLNNVSVTFNNVPAPLHFVAPGQINAQVPWDVLPSGSRSGNAAVVVTSGGVASAPATVSVGPFSPGIFARDFGVGNAIVINADGSLAAPADSMPGIPARPARAGDPNGLIILATGLGALDSVPPNGNNSLDRLRRNLTTPEVLIGGMSAPVAFAGASPQFVGVNQINITIPDGAPVGDRVPLQLRLGGMTTTDRVTIAVSLPASGCVNIAGRWLASEEGTLRCTLTVQGGSVTETDPISGVDIVTISQQGCQVSYSSPSIMSAFGSGRSVRQGEVEGTTVKFSGIMGELAPGFSYEKNLVEASGTVQNNVITLTAAGTLIASGTWQGMNTKFSCTATTKARMTKSP